MKRLLAGEKETNIMGVDQYGDTYHGLGKYPRKMLLDRLGYKSAQVMYQDKKDGTTVKTGYVIGRHWVSLYKVEPLEIKV